MKNRSEGWTSEIQIHYPLIKEVAMSPKGDRVLITVREPLLTDEKSEFITHIYCVNVKTGEARQLTYGEHSERNPSWSPSGKYIAFISNRKEKTNLFIMRSDGGEAWTLTQNEKFDISSIKWSPDEKYVGFLMPEPPTDEEERKEKAKNDAYLWHEDFNYQHLYIVPFTNGASKSSNVNQVTKGKFHVLNFEWIPNSNQIAISYQPTPLTEEWVNSRLGLVSSETDNPVNSEEIKEIGILASWNAEIKASPDGKWIAAVTGDIPAAWAFSSGIILYSIDGNAKQELSRTPDDQVQLIGWSRKGDKVYCCNSEGVSTHIWELPVSVEGGRKITNKCLIRKSFSIGSSGVLSFAAEDFDMINSLHILDPVDLSEKTIYKPDPPDEWPKDLTPKTKVITWNSKDGREIEGVIYYPLDYKEGKKYPLIVEVHGGPTGVYGRSYFADLSRYGNTAVLCQKGFMILRANPRGSSGYGKEFRFANYNDWGGGDYKDIMSGVDYLINQGMVDPEKLGILGWSYGGFMTSWTITQTDIFKAACVGAGVTNLMSFNGTSDIPSFIPDYFHGEFWDDLDPYQNHSALFQVKGVKTPTLIQHGEKDERVPLSQGQELFNALKKQGVPTHLVIYPRQPHGIEEPRLLMDRADRAVKWFERWILEDDKLEK